MKKLQEDSPILVVDDLGEMRMTLRMTLEDLGFTNITESPNGEDALKKFQLNEYALIIADFKMPVRDGLDLLKDVRDRPTGRDLPFFMISGAIDRSEAEEAITAGVTDFIGKPFSADIVERKLKQVFELDRPRDREDW